MGLQKQLLPIIVLWFCYSSSSSRLLEDTLSTCNDEASSYNQFACPTYFGTTGEYDHEFNPELSTIFKSEPLILTSDDSDHVGNPLSSPKIVNVDDFGAKGDGTDDTKAFEKAWKKACSSAPSVLVVPANKNYLLKPVTFSGPCKSSIEVLIHGTIEAPSDKSAWDGLKTTHWIVFQKVQNFIVGGGGTINGNGEIWWKSSCKIDPSLPCTVAPTALTFHLCKNLMVNGLKIKDSQQIHVSFRTCVNVQASNLMISAPETSPNTDGIHITNTQNIQIMKSVIGTGKWPVIGTGDDCISIESGSQNVKATRIRCGPGHGISIGSLGDRNTEAHVSQVTVDGATFSGATNGVRIKTWQGGSGSATNIRFQNIAMHNVARPIIIDQNYCDSKEPCPEQKSAVKVRDVFYKNIKGTSASHTAVTFNCSSSIPCNGIVLQGINLVGNAGQKTSSSCNNVKGNTIGKVIPPSCF